MSNAIQFLEAMGKNAAMSRLSVGDYAAAIAGLDADGSQQRALLERDQVSLSNLLGGRQNVLFAVMTPDGDRIEEQSEIVGCHEARHAS